MTKSILIIGGAGFVGSNLCRLALSRGHEVDVLDNFISGKKEYINTLNIKIHECSLFDVNQLTKLFKNKDYIIHLAALGNVIESIQDPYINFETNVKGTLNILQAIKTSGVENLIFSSTGGALMGKVIPPVNEETNPSPISPYGASKLACEGYIKAFSECYGINYKIFRFGNVLGLNCLHKKGVLNTYYNKLSNNQMIDVFGNVSRDFIYVDDLNNAILNSLDIADINNQVFHLASGIETNIIDVARKISNMLGVNEDKIKISNHRTGEVARNFSDISKAKKMIGLENTKTAMEAIEEVINYLQYHHSS